MVAPHEHTTDEVKANIRRVSHNKGRGDNEGPVGIGSGAGPQGSAGSMTTKTHNVEPVRDDDDAVNKRPL
jgi:hypothetical protein